MLTKFLTCRLCKKATSQRERIVTDNLPPYVRVMECGLCGSLSIVLDEESE